METVLGWLRRQLANPQVVGLTLIVLLLGISIWLFGRILAPVLGSLVIAYLLDTLATRLRRRGVPHLLAVLLVFTLFLAILLVCFFWLAPLLTRQMAQLFQQVPFMVAEVQLALLKLPQEYPNFISEQQIKEMFSGVSSELLRYGQRIVTFSVASLMTLITLLVYLVLVPILVFFLLKDKAMLTGWVAGFLPRDRRLSEEVWVEVDRQIGNYVRGKFVEILIVGFVAWIAFRLLGLQYAVLLAAVTGVSVLIPYVGATVVALPVALVAYFQFGLAAQFYWVMIAYGVIQFLDGNVLVPLLFSEAVNLHPVAIIVAILFFGGLWGFWGIFFAIPLATVIQAILRAWPREEMAVMPLADTGAQE
ncbi:AI-2E family transporter [Thioalkalivibrio sp. XN279]|uniref:AI-2E family transporter n=1 Tax=Thioalkalivibrio sp. XN279 TaxID=2714953 RepID=UPI00140A60E2|nr:AI-2E family transporter [Thioalkalivibrio sp. XN279]NHA13591.1 AI-2E family transporter [Thioalkalivibrio sp. XN279]